MPEHFEIYIVYKKALYKYASFPFLLLTSRFTDGRRLSWPILMGAARTINQRSDIEVDRLQY